MNLDLLLQVGEEKLVLEFGRAALQLPDAKPYIHDLLLSMALAEVRYTNKEILRFHFFGNIFAFL